LAGDPRTLQGRWVGSIEVPQVSGETPKRVPISFDLSAQYKDEFFYTVSGTAQLEGKSYPVRGTPTFDYDEKILRPQNQPTPNPPVFELLEGDAVVYSTNYLPWQKDKNRYQGNFSRQNLPANFSLTLERLLILPPLEIQF